MKNMVKDKWELAELIWNGFCVLLGFGFMVFSEVIGGSAGNGYCEGSHYYVGNHGFYTEVSEGIWNISYVWGNIFILLLFIDLAGVGLIKCIRKIADKRKTA